MPIISFYQCWKSFMLKNFEIIRRKFRKKAARNNDHKCTIFALIFDQTGCLYSQTKLD